MEGKVANESPLSIAGLVLGVIAMCFSFIPIINNLSYILGILAVIFSIIGLTKKETNGKNIAALILGALSIIITLSVQDAISTLFNGKSTGSTEWEYIFSVLCWSVFWGIVSNVLGKNKGINGFWYGFCLGLIGFIIVACMKSRDELSTEPKVIVNDVVESKEDKFNALEKLHELKTNGVITEEEYVIEKNKILH